MGIRVTNEATNQGKETSRVWRRLASVALAYALVIQAVFLGLVGTRLTASAADNGLPGFELCLHGPQSGPPSPVDLPGRQGDNHCAFCFAGAFQSLAPPPQAPVQHVEVNAGIAWWTAPGWLEPQPARYAIARPRGPPLEA